MNYKIRGFTLERFVALRNSEYATAYLKSSLAQDIKSRREGTCEKSRFGIALGEVLKATLKSVSRISEETGISQASLYRVFKGEQGDSSFGNISKLLESAGLEIEFRPMAE